MMRPESKILNLERSFNKYFKENFEDVYLPPTTIGGETRYRVSYDDAELVVDGINEWVEIHFLSYGTGVTSESTVQVTVTTKRDCDPYKSHLKEVADQVRDVLNINSIPIFDFGSADSPGGGAAATLTIDGTDTELAAAIRQTGPGLWLNEIEDVYSLAIEYSLFLWRDDIVE